MNAYEMFDEVKDNIGRDEVGGHWTEAGILRKLNKGQRYAYHLISQTSGDWFLKSELLTPVDSVITLPTDCAKPVYMEDVATGLEVPINTTVRERRNSRIGSVNLESAGYNAYLLGETIVINQDSNASQVRLWYERRVPDLHFGTAAAGAATSLTLEASKQASLQADYYNGVILETVSGTGAPTRDTISDYAALTRVCVVTGTYDSTTVYGTVSVLPIEACDLIILDATLALLAKPSSALDPKYFEYFLNQHKKAEVALEDWCSMRLKNSNRVRRIGNG